MPQAIRAISRQIPEAGEQRVPISVCMLWAVKSQSLDGGGLWVTQPGLDSTMVIHFFKLSPWAGAILTFCDSRHELCMRHSLSGGKLQGHELSKPLLGSLFLIYTRKYSQEPSCGYEDLDHTLPKCIT